MSQHVCEHTDRPLYARGLCKPCYNRLRRQEDPTVVERQRSRSRAWYAKHGKDRHKRRRPWLRARWLQQQYGITVADYEALFARQQGRCAICLAPPGKTALHVDHDHTTGAVRGLLCGPCNRALGFLKDKPELALAAYNYLRAPFQQEAA